MKSSKNLMYSILTVLTFTMFLSSCEKDKSINDKQKNTTHSELDERFKNYQLVEIDNKDIWMKLEDQKQETVKLDFKNATTNSSFNKFSFTLNRMKVEADDFNFYLIAEDGQIQEPDISTPHVLDGKIDNDGGNAFMIVNEFNFRAEFNKNDEVYRLEPLSDHLKEASPDTYINYKVEDVIVKENITCEVENNKDNNFYKLETENHSTSNSAANCYKVEITFMGDYALYAWRFNYNFDNTYNWMYWKVVNAGRMYYSNNGYPLNFILKSGYVNNWNGYIANSSNNANNFILQWQNFVVNNSNWFDKGDANILFTGQDIQSNVIGVAYISSICNNNYGYNWGGGSFGVVEHQWYPYYEDITTAHEIGHILGAGHSNGGFMNSSINGQSWMHSSTWNDLNNWLPGHSWCLGNWGCQW